MARNSSKPASPFRLSALPDDLTSFEIGNLLRKAELAFDGGDFAKAVGCCQEVLKRKANQPKALQLLGRMAQKTGANDVAIGFFKRALTIERALMSARLGLGDAYMASKQWHAAATSYRKAIALEPKNVEAHSSLGAALLALGDRQKAIGSFRRATAIDPHHKLSAYMISELYAPPTHRIRIHCRSAASRKTPRPGRALGRRVRACAGGSPTSARASALEYPHHGSSALRIMTSIGYRRRFPRPSPAQGKPVPG